MPASEVKFFCGYHDGFSVVNCYAAAFEELKNFFFSFLFVFLQFFGVAAQGSFYGAGVAGFEFFLDLS